MTDEEIRKIASEYAEYMCPVGDYCGGVSDDQRNADLPIYKDDAKSVLEWLSKDYCIVPKSKVKELYAKTESDHCHVDEDNDWVVDMMLGRMEDIFGKEMFEEEGK